MAEMAFDQFETRYERVRLLARDAELTEADLGEFEARMDAALRAFATGGAVIRDILDEAIAADDESMAAGAVVAAHELDREWLSSEVIERFEDLGADARIGVAIGLGRVANPDHAGPFESLAAAPDPLTRACAAQVLAGLGRAEPAGLSALLDDEDEAVRELAWSAAGAFRSPAVTRERVEADPLPRALEAAAEVGLAELADVCRAVCAEHPHAATLLGVVGPTDVRATLVELTRSDDVVLAEAALAGLGALGDVAAIPCVLDALRDPLKLRAAGVSFRRLTGATDLDGEAPVRCPDSIIGDDADLWDDSPAEVDAERAAVWWRENAARFSPESRWQEGRAPSPDDPELSLRVRHDERLRARQP